MPVHTFLSMSPHWSSGDIKFKLSFSVREHKKLVVSITVKGLKQKILRKVLIWIICFIL